MRNPKLLKAKREAALARKRRVAIARKKALDQLLSSMDKDERDRKEKEYINSLTGNKKSGRRRFSRGQVLGGQGQMKKKGSHGS